MRKILLALFFTFNITLGFNTHEGIVPITQQANAQQVGCPSWGSASTGGGFWTWLSNAFNSAGNAIGGALQNVYNSISDFLSGDGNGGDGDGEEFGEEDEDESPFTGGSWGGQDEIQINYNGSNDPWGNPYFNEYEYSQQEWEILNNLGYYYNVYTNGGVLPPPPPKHYITVDNAPSKYFENDKIYLHKTDSQHVFYLHKENSTVNATDLIWKWEDTTKCINQDYCASFNLTHPDSYKLQVDSATRRLIKVKVIVYDIPTIVFQAKNGYAGEYGFDDSTHKHSQISRDPDFDAGYEFKRINHDTSYIVPWMSILDSQTATVKIKKIGLDNDIENDPNFWVEFRPTTTNTKINNQEVLHVNYSELKNLNQIQIYSTETDSSDERLKFISSVNVITQNGDTIGKLNMSCVKPKPKLIKFVYVKTGHHFNSSLTIPNIMAKLNAKSHNQMFRKWQQTTIPLPDTLDFTSEWQLIHNNMIAAYFPTKFSDYYLINNGISIDSITRLHNGVDPRKIHFFFIADFDVVISSIDSVSGNTITSTLNGRTSRGGAVGSVFNTASLNTVAHELGHILNHEHTYDSPFNIQKSSTYNLLDYVCDGCYDNRKFFAYFQWKTTY
jgi:hypothetical protein